MVYRTSDIFKFQPYKTIVQLVVLTRHCCMHSLCIIVELARIMIHETLAVSEDTSLNCLSAL